MNLKVGIFFQPSYYNFYYSFYQSQVFFSFSKKKKDYKGSKMKSNSGIGRVEIFS